MVRAVNAMCAAFRPGNFLADHFMVTNMIPATLKRQLRLPEEAMARRFNDLAAALRAAYSSIASPMSYRFVFITDGTGDQAEIVRLLQNRPPQASLLLILIGNQEMFAKQEFQALLCSAITFLSIDVSKSALVVDQQITDKLRESSS